jgi:hypothetical protein
MLQKVSFCFLNKLFETINFNLFERKRHNHFYSHPAEEVAINQLQFDTSAQDMINSLVMGFDYSSLLNTLSSKYCMCDVFEEYSGYQPINYGLFDLTSMLGQEQSIIKKARNRLSTLQIPNMESKRGSEDQTSPSTVPEFSPMLQKSETSLINNFRDSLTQSQMICGSAFAHL